MTELSAERATSPPRLRECAGCGLFQTVPPLARGMVARCERRSTTLHRTTSHPIHHSIAHSAYLFSGPAELIRRNMAALAAVVVFVTVIAPFGKLIGTLYVLIRLHETVPPSHLRRIFKLIERLRPWSMMEVFASGLFVAYVKLGDLVQITLDDGVYALLALTFVLIWVDSAFDRDAVWERLGRGGPDCRRAGSARQYLASAIGCEVCGLVSTPLPDDPRCPRCDRHLHPRKPDSIGRTWPW